MSQSLISQNFSLNICIHLNKDDIQRCLGRSVFFVKILFWHLLIFSVGLQKEPLVLFMSTCTCDPHPDDLCGANENPVCIVCLSALIGPHNHCKLLFQNLVIENETLFLGERKQFSSFQMSLTRRAYQH